MAVITTEREPSVKDAPKTPAWKRRADIQGLRGLAVLLVVMYHADRHVQGGYIGVDVFFVLSGFVITGMVLAQLNSSPGFSIAQFYLNRVVRLLPALALVLSAVALAAPFAISPLGPMEATINTGRAASLFHANIDLTAGVGYFSIGAETNPLLHMWSLSVEEQFYLAFPVVLLGVRSLGRRHLSSRQSWTPMALVAVAVPSFYVAQQTVNGRFDGVIDAPEAFAFYSSFTRAWEFLAGAVLVFVLQSGDIREASRRWFGLTGLALILFGSLAMNDGTVFPGLTAFVPVMGTCLLIAGGGSKGSLVNSLLSSRPLIWLGDRSYSWYLWHWPAIVFARSLWPDVGHIRVIAAIASIIPAALAFSLVEQPVRGASLWSYRRNIVGLGAACILIPLGLFSLATPILEATQSGETEAFVESQESHADFTRGCDGEASLAEKGPSCFWQAPESSGHTVVLLGDSNAGHLTEPLAEASNAAGYDFIAATKSSCPFNDLVVIKNDSVLEVCREFVTGSIDDLLNDPPEIVFLSSSDRYLRDLTVAFADPSSGRQESATGAKADLYSSQLRLTVEQLVEAGIRVHIIQTVPHLFLGPEQSQWNPLRCGAQALRDPLGCGMTVPRDATYDRIRAIAGEAILEAIEDIDGASSVDFIDDLCEAESCNAYANGMWMYSDGGHLSVQGSLLLTPRFEALIREDR